MHKTTASVSYEFLLFLVRGKINQRFLVQLHIEWLNLQKAREVIERAPLSLQKQRLIS